MSQDEFTVSCEILDRKKGLVLMQERLLTWKGIAFPGGHVETGESFSDACVREVFEETGLKIRNAQCTGMVHFYHRKTESREIILCFVAEDFSGELVPETEEGRNFWLPMGEIRKQKLSAGLEEQLPAFEQDGFKECFYDWREGEEPKPLWRKHE